MTTQEERIKILSMLQEGVINAEQAAKLLEALGSIGVESKSKIGRASCRERV